MEVNDGKGETIITEDVNTETTTVLLLYFDGHIEGQ